MSSWERDPTTGNFNLIGGIQSDSKDEIVSFTSSDTADADATAWTSVAVLATGEKHSSILAKISQMFKNVRYLYKQMSKNITLNTTYTLFIGVYGSQGIGLTQIMIPKPTMYKLVVSKMYVKRVQNQAASFVETNLVRNEDVGYAQIIQGNWQTLNVLEVPIDCKIEYYLTTY